MGSNRYMVRGVFPRGNPLALEASTADRGTYVAQRYRTLSNCTDVALYRVHDDGHEVRLPPYEEALASLNAIARQRDNERAEREAERKAWARLLAAERAHHDHTLLLSDAERDEDMKGPRAAVVEAEEALLALGVDPEDPENLRAQLDRQDDAETAADRNHPLDAEFPNDADGRVAGLSPPAFSSDERRMALRCVTWLEAHAEEFGSQADDECDGCDADAFCAQAATIRDAAREMAKAFGVETPR